MNFIRNIQRRFARTGGLPNLMLYVTCTMMVVFLLPMFTGNSVTQLLSLSREAVLAGQVWRLVTFIFIPENSGSLISMLLSLYFYYWVGSALEQYWGSGSFTFYYLCGMAGAIIAAMITGFGTATYLHLSLFLAFAQLFPEMEVLLMFMLPIKVKYLGYFAWAMYAFSFLASPWAGRAAMLASVINFLLFFGDDFIGWLKNEMRYGRQRRQWRATQRQYRGNDNRR